MVVMSGIVVFDELVAVVVIVKCSIAKNESGVEGGGAEFVVSLLGGNDNFVHEIAVVGISDIWIALEESFDEFLVGLGGLEEAGVDNESVAIAHTAVIVSAIIFFASYSSQVH